MSHDEARCQILFCPLCLNPKVAASQGREEEAQAERGDGMSHDYAEAGAPFPPLDAAAVESYASDLERDGLPTWEARRLASVICAKLE